MNISLLFSVWPCTVAKLNCCEFHFGSEWTDTAKLNCCEFHFVSEWTDTAKFDCTEFLSLERFGYLFIKKERNWPQQIRPCKRDIYRPNDKTGDKAQYSLTGFLVLSTFQFSVATTFSLLKNQFSSDSLVVLFSTVDNILTDCFKLPDYRNINPLFLFFRTRKAISSFSCKQFITTSSLWRHIFRHRFGHCFNVSWRALVKLKFTHEIEKKILLISVQYYISFHLLITSFVFGFSPRLFVVSHQAKSGPNLIIH